MNALAERPLRVADVEPIAEEIERFVRGAGGKVDAAMIYEEFANTGKLAVAKAIRVAIEKHLVRLNDDLSVSLS